MIIILILILVLLYLLRILYCRCFRKFCPAAWSSRKVEGIVLISESPWRHAYCKTLVIFKLHLLTVF